MTTQGRGQDPSPKLQGPYLAAPAFAAFLPRLLRSTRHPNLPPDRRCSLRRPRRTSPRPQSGFGSP